MSTEDNGFECPMHGEKRKRASCRACNSAYMRHYQRKRRAQNPDLAILDRARYRARQADVRYTLRRDDIIIPARCPALGIELWLGRGRSPHSPSLDRLDPGGGYVPANVRVISDRANLLKGNWTLAQIVNLVQRGPKQLRAEYAMIAAYIEREELLTSIRLKAANGGVSGTEWRKVAEFLERAFHRNSTYVVGSLARHEPIVATRRNRSRLFSRVTNTFIVHRVWWDKLLKIVSQKMTVVNFGIVPAMQDVIDCDCVKVKDGKVMEPKPYMRFRRDSRQPGRRA